MNLFLSADVRNRAIVIAESLVRGARSAERGLFSIRGWCSKTVSIDFSWFPSKTGFYSSLKGGRFKMLVVSVALVVSSAL